ncbi:putative diguanylate cyclase YedQ [Rubripirellula amarantea]|uniref:diguanylate cyclase n=1 Tax=Rubripirellula amarantea TaxID=2527999 RepID=A0A5C5WVR1_9BACT|nr:sensor domain-containing diguanylate cyclase [Rubripirellula amarantea]TWT53932.1 putative diguanylate cyclase YedQ [Rubripirellula amarantea]
MPFSKPCSDACDDTVADINAEPKKSPPELRFAPLGGAAHFAVTLLVVNAMAWTFVFNPSGAIDGGALAMGTSVIILALLAHQAICRREGSGFHKNAALSGQLEAILDQMPDGLLITDQHDRIVIANDAFLRSIGMTKEDLIGRRASSLSWVHGAARETRDLPWVQASRQSTSRDQQLMRYRLPGGEERYFSINSSPVKSDDDDQQGALMTFRDVTQIENHRAELEQMLVMLRSSREEIRTKNHELRVLADIDSLTGCLNRRAFFEEFRRAWEAAQERQHPLSCLMLDVDHFKQVNDVYGHQWGDEILQLVSTILQNQFPEPSLIGRYGGEEFCVMMPGISLADAMQMCEQTRVCIASHRFWDLPELNISASFGLATLNPGVSRVEDLIRQADECLYMAKENGRNRVVSRLEYRRLAEDQADKLDPTSVR